MTLLVCTLSLLSSAAAFSLRPDALPALRPCTSSPCRRTSAPAPTMLITADMASLFGNVRVPAALIAGASLPLGFAFPFPSKSDRLGVRALKAVNVGLGYLSVQSELLAILVSTNAINRLSAGSTFVNSAGATTIFELLKQDPALLQHWLGTYIHFNVGVFCITTMCGIRGWLAVGPSLGVPLISLTLAILARLVAATNRGIVAQEFGGGNVLLLTVNFLWTFTCNTFKRLRWCDLLSLGMLLLACVQATRRAGLLFTQYADEDGDGATSKKEMKGLLRELMNDLTQED